MKNILLMLILSAHTLHASGWRTDGKSTYPESQIPLSWSQEENVVWKTKLPKWSNASPVIAGDRIFICAEPASILCLSKKDGSILWQAEHPLESFLTDEEKSQLEKALPQITELKKTTGELNKKLRELRKEIKDEAQRKEAEIPLRKELDTLNSRLAELDRFSLPKTHNSTGYTSPTTACDGNNVVVLFGYGAAACYTVKGEKKWARVIGRSTHQWGSSSSPLIADGTAVVKVTDILGLDIETGTEKWRVPSNQVFGSLALSTINGEACAVSACGKIVRIKDGKLIAKDLHKLEYNTPLVVNNVVYFIENGGKAFRLPAADTDQPELLWTTTPKKERYYASPLYLDGLLYAVSRYGDFSVIDAADGKVIHEEKLKIKGECYPSPVLAGEHILIGSEGGETIILKPGRKPSEVARNTLEKYRSTPVLEAARMYIRTLDHLYCIGK